MRYNGTGQNYFQINMYENQVIGIEIRGVAEIRRTGTNQDIKLTPVG